MIISFKNRTTERIYYEGKSKAFSAEVIKSTRKKLMILNSAETLADLRVPPGNRLEKLAGDYAGFFSIRVNDQYRICFRFHHGQATEVELTDYHR